MPLHVYVLFFFGGGGGASKGLLAKSIKTWSSEPLKGESADANNLTINFLYYPFLLFFPRDCSPTRAYIFAAVNDFLQTPFRRCNNSGISFPQNAVTTAVRIPLVVLFWIAASLDHLNSLFTSCNFWIRMGSPYAPDRECGIWCLKERRKNKCAWSSSLLWYKEHIESITEIFFVFFCVLLVLSLPSHAFHLQKSVVVY